MTPFDAATWWRAKHAGGTDQGQENDLGVRRGDTVAALNQAGVAAISTYVSTAGGAFLNGWRATRCQVSRF